MILSASSTKILIVVSSCAQEYQWPYPDDDRNRKKLVKCLLKNKDSIREHFRPISFQEFKNKGISLEALDDPEIAEIVIEVHNTYKAMHQLDSSISTIIERSSSDLLPREMYMRAIDNSLRILRTLAEICPDEAETMIDEMEALPWCDYSFDDIR